MPGRRNVIEDRDNQAYPFTTFELRDPIRVRRLRVENGELVLEDLAEITAIDPAAAGRAADEMLGVALRRITHSSPEDGAAVNV